MSPHFHSFAKGRADKHPTDAYWARPEFQSSREQFYAYINKKDNQERMRLSTYGAIEGLSYAPIDPGREARWRQARKEAIDAA